MRKLFLFILVLFGILSAQTLASGCNAQICMCPNGGYVSTNQYCSAPPERPYGGVSVDPVTRKYGASWNFSDGATAQSEALNSCRANSNSNRCVSTWASYYYTAVAVSSDDKVIKFGSSDSYGSAWDSAIKNCQNAGGFECEVMLMTSNSSGPDVMGWGSLSYNPKTGKGGRAWNHYTRREATAASEKSCGSTECESWGFQSIYASMAMSPNSDLIVGVSNKNMKDADKDAKKRCKKEFKVKECEIVLRGMAESEYKEK